MPLARIDLAEGKRAGSGVFASSEPERVPSDAEFEKSHFSFEVVGEMGLDGEQRFLASFKAAKHDRAFKLLLRRSSHGFRIRCRNWLTGNCIPCSFPDRSLF
jgi:hypothetical protein